MLGNAVENRTARATKDLEKDGMTNLSGNRVNVCKTVHEFLLA
jgi:hypothetical protein